MTDLRDGGKVKVVYSNSAVSASLFCISCECDICIVYYTYWCLSVMICLHRNRTITKSKGGGKKNGISVQRGSGDCTILRLPRLLLAP